MGDTDAGLRAWLAAIGALTAAVNAGRDLREVLDLVAGTARDLLGLDFCGVLVPDAAERNLVIAGWSGLTAEYVARVNSDRPVRLEATADGGAPSSRAFRSGRPCAVVDIAREPDFIWGGVAREQGYRSMLSVPLRTGSGVLGTLNSYRSASGEFGAEEVDRLQMLAEHTAVAITTARVLEDLRRQHDLAIRSEEIHERLLRVALREGGVGGIATALHELLGSPVHVRDAHGEVLAGSGFPLPDVGEEPGPDLVRDAGDHVVVDVLLAGEVAARVWVPGRAGTLAPLDRRALEHASIVLSLELLRRRTALEVEQNLRGDLLGDLLSGADPASAAVRARAGLLGHDLAIPHRVVVARVGVGGDPVGPTTLQRTVTEAVRLAARLRPRPLVAAHRGLVVALWPVAAAEHADVLRRALLSVRGVDDVTVAVSTTTAGGIVGAHRTARGALEVAVAAGRTGRTVTLDDLGVAGLLLQLGDPAPLRDYAERTLGPLVRYDDEHGTALLHTLRAHLDARLDRRVTGRALTVHPNTVSQRLRRIEALTGLDLAAPDAVVEARAALVVLDVATGLGNDAAPAPR